MDDGRTIGMTWEDRIIGLPSRDDVNASVLSLMKGSWSDTVLSNSDVLRNIRTWFSALAENGCLYAAVSALNALSIDAACSFLLDNIGCLFSRHRKLIDGFAESDSQYRMRLIESRGGYSDFTQSLLAKIYDISTVRKCVVLENPTSEKVTKEGVTLDPHSVYIGVDGTTSSIGIEGEVSSEDDNEIAMAIFGVKACGCGMTKSSTASVVRTVTVVDSESGARHEIVFNRAVEKKFYARAYLRKRVQTIEDSEVIDAATTAAEKWNDTGTDHVSGLSLGVTAYRTELGALISDTIKEVDIHNIRFYNTLYQPVTRYALFVDYTRAPKKDSAVADCIRGVPLSSVGAEFRSGTVYAKYQAVMKSGSMYRRKTAAGSGAWKDSDWEKVYFSIPYFGNSRSNPDEENTTPSGIMYNDDVTYSTTETVTVPQFESTVFAYTVKGADLTPSRPDTNFIIYRSDANYYYGYATLQDAFDNANSGDRIYLCKDVTLTSANTFRPKTSKTVYLDLSGYARKLIETSAEDSDSESSPIYGDEAEQTPYTLTFSGNGSISVGNGTLIIMDSANSDRTDKDSVYVDYTSGSNYSSVKYALNVTGSTAKLIIAEGKYTLNNERNFIGLFGVTSGSLTVNYGVFNGKSHIVMVGRGATATINGGVYSFTHTLAYCGGTLEFNGGEYTAACDKDYTAFFCSSSSAKVTFNGGSFELYNKSKSMFLVGPVGSYTVNNGSYFNIFCIKNPNDSYFKIDGGILNVHHGDYFEASNQNHYSPICRGSLSRDDFRKSLVNGYGYEVGNGGIMRLYCTDKTKCVRASWYINGTRYTAHKDNVKSYNGVASFYYLSTGKNTSFTFPDVKKGYDTRAFSPMSEPIAKPVMPKYGKEEDVENYAKIYAKVYVVDMTSNKVLKTEFSDNRILFYQNGEKTPFEDDPVASDDGNRYMTRNYGSAVLVDEVDTVTCNASEKAVCESVDVVFCDDRGRQMGKLSFGGSVLDTQFVPRSGSSITLSFSVPSSPVANALVVGYEGSIGVMAWINSSSQIVFTAGAGSDTVLCSAVGGRVYSLTLAFSDTNVKATLTHMESGTDVTDKAQTLTCDHWADYARPVCVFGSKTQTTKSRVLRGDVYSFSAKSSSTNTVMGLVPWVDCNGLACFRDSINGNIVYMS